MSSAILDPPISEFRRSGIYNYSKVQELISNVPAQSIPAKWINPNAYKIALRDQGDRGTCVGQSIAYSFDLNLMKLASWTPDVSTVKRNIIIEVGDRKILKDELPYGSASAEMVYQVSREYGNVTYPSGSYIEYAIKVWNKYGICYDDIWWTSKTPLFSNNTAYPAGREAAMKAATTHTIDGYATTMEFDEIKRAIYNNGFVNMAINVFENWEGNNKEGLFPDPKGEVIGSHALCWVGYDENALYCLHTWNGWSMLGGISRTYWNKHKPTAWIPLDATEAEVAKTTYLKLTVTTDVPCDIEINKDTFKNVSTATGAFEPRWQVIISATPVGRPEAKQSKVIIMDKETTISFTFPENIQEAIVRSRFAALIELLMKYIGKR